jgi:hypothetical protein
MCELCSGISRRVFLGTTGALSTGLLFGGLPAPAAALQDSGNDWEQRPPVRVYVVYIGAQYPGWPRAQFDCPAEIRDVFVPQLEAVGKKLGDVEFIGGELIANSWSPDEANALIAKIAEKEADAVLIIQLTLGSPASYSAFASTGLPTAIYSQLFSGHQWIYVPELQRNGAKLIFGASGDLNDIERLVALLRVPAKMKTAKLVMVGPPGCASGTAASCDYAKVKEAFGTEVIHVTPQEFVEIHHTISDDDAIAEAEEYWISKAMEIREPSREEIIKSAKTYYAMKKLMNQHGAIALSMKCLGGIPIDILGYPCLGFSRIMDDGAIGTCEADMDSTLTMMMFLYAFGKPGFITDPVMDFPNNAVIHAHCVSATKMAGPQTDRLPFIIRSHLEDGKGASLKVFVDRDMDHACTVAKLANNDTLLVSSGKLKGSCDSPDRGCRTQMITEVTSTSARELYAKWGGNVLGHDMMTLLHRVLFYGDHLDDFRDIAQLMGLKFMVEGIDMA